MKRKSAALAVSAALVHLVLLAQPAAAYIDPGAGSYLWQLLIGSFLGGLALIGVFWTKVRAFFGRLFGRKGVTPAPEPQGGENQA